MGGGGSRFTREELDVYEAVTCLSGAEILELHDKFRQLGGEKADDAAVEINVRGSGDHMRMSTRDAEAGTSTGRREGRCVAKETLINQSELRNNPFKERLCEIFSSFESDSPDYGSLNFDEFVDLYNVMSPRASKDVKMQTAFRLYDYDGNGYLTPEDIVELVKAISTTQRGKELLSAKEITSIVDAVMRDCARRACHSRSCAAAKQTRRGRYFAPDGHGTYACVLTCGVIDGVSTQVISTATTDCLMLSFRKWSAKSPISRLGSSCTLFDRLVDDQLRSCGPRKRACTGRMVGGCMGRWEQRTVQVGVDLHRLGPSMWNVHVVCMCTIACSYNSCA